MFARLAKWQFWVRCPSCGRWLMTSPPAGDRLGPSIAVVSWRIVIMIQGLSRRQFVMAGGQMLAAARLAGMGAGKPQVGLVQSVHRKLSRTLGPDQELDYSMVREMVWKAIEYGKPRAGSLEAKIKPGSWVVIKPNIVYLKPQIEYRSGDVTDQRVTRAVFEYVAEKSKAARITRSEER